MSQAVAGVRKKSSMGRFLGEEMKAVRMDIMTPEREAERDEPVRLARAATMPLQAIEKWTVPDEREEEPRYEKSDEINGRHHADLQHRMLHGDGAGVQRSGSFSGEGEDDFGEKQQEAGEADEEKGVAEVGDAARSWILESGRFRGSE